jgi:uncharacterized protein (DUF608 family)
VNRPFNPDLPKHQWTLIEAEGFPEPAPGCVYSGARLDGGVPLGGLGTGYFTLEGSGKAGYCSIYNDIVPPRRDFKEWLTVRLGKARLPLSTAEITYWGHFPIADIVATFPGKPLTIGIRAFSPFIVGSAADSNIPAALFEVELNNHGSETIEAELIITPPAPPQGQAAQASLQGDRIAVESDAAGLRGSLPMTIPPGASRRARFVFGWYAPHWRDSGGEPHVHRYGSRYDTASAVAEDALKRFDSLLAGILAWQREVYRADLPGWLRDWLVQSFYSLAKNTVWIARTRRDEWWGEDGWFTHNESHTGCPITETMVCRMHGHFPALLFFPELEAATLEAFRHFQIADGEIPFSYGIGTAMRDPRYHCQHPLNSGQYAQMVYHLFLRTRDQQQLSHFYDSAKRAIRYQFSLDDDGDGLVNDQAHVRPGEHWPANQFYDIWPWWGTSAYVAGTWLGTLAIGRAMARAMGDDAFAAECEEWLTRGARAYQEKLWTGEYYRLWDDPQNDKQCDVSLGNQLMGEWCAKVAGLPGVLPRERVESALTAVERLNMTATEHGLVNGVTPEGERFDAGHPEENDHGKHIFVGENLCAAMTFIYHNRRDVGLEIARRLYEAIALRSCSPWNQRCLINAETGLPVWGDDYYSNMVVWAVPMAIAGEGIGGFVGDGKLVSRMIQAARSHCE